MPPTKTRTVGSGFTTFMFSGKPIAFLDEIHDSGQGPIRPYEAVTPLGDYYPREFVFPRVKSEGQLQFIIREMWDMPSWWALTGFANTYNIIDVYNYQAGTPRPITCTTLVKMPYGMPASVKNRGWTYANVNLVNIDDREVVQIGTLTMPRTITAIYANKVYFPSPGYAAPGTTLPAGNQPGPIGQFAKSTQAKAPTQVVGPNGIPPGAGGY